MHWRAGRAGGLPRARQHPDDGRRGAGDQPPATSTLCPWRWGQQPRRRIRFMVKSEMLGVGIMRFLIRHTGTVSGPLDEPRRAYEKAVATLRAGELIGVYPEATLVAASRSKGSKSGAVRMAAAAGVPVIPIITWGAHRQLSKGGIRSMGRKRSPSSSNMVHRSTCPTSTWRQQNRWTKVAALRATMVAILHPMQRPIRTRPGNRGCRRGRGAARPPTTRPRSSKTRSCCQSGCPAKKRQSGRR